MKPLAECAPCILEWTFERTAPLLDENQRVELMRTLLHVKTVFIPDESGSLMNNAFREIDLVIAKGTFNFESLLWRRLWKNRHLHTEKQVRTHFKKFRR